MLKTINYCLILLNVILVTIIVSLNMPIQEKVNTTDYIWLDNTSHIDNDFIRICYKFSKPRTYINNTYNCINYSKDFYDLFTILSYPVGVITIYDQNITLGHRLNYFKHIDGTITYIEPQNCDFFPDFDSVTLHYYNYTTNDTIKHSKIVS